jgi:hypothetical protein
VAVKTLFSVLAKSQVKKADSAVIVDFSLVIHH